MARKKKPIIIDTTGMRDIEAYTHEDKKRTNNPPVGMAQHDTASETRKTYAFDPHIDPTPDWAGNSDKKTFLCKWTKEFLANSRSKQEQRWNRDRNFKAKF